MYRKNTANQNLGFRLLNASTGAALTGASVAVKRVIDNGAFQDATGTVTEKGDGLYNYTLSQDDTNGNQISFLFTATGAVPEEKTILTTAANPADPQALGLGRLDATVSSRLASTAAPANFAALVISAAGLIDSNVVQVNGQPAQASTDPVSANITQVGGQAIAGNTVPATIAGTVAANVTQVDGQSLIAGTVPATITGTVAANVTQVGGQAIAGNAVPATLVATGLDAISVADPGGVAQMNSLPRMIVALWRRFYKKTTQDAVAFRSFADDGVTVNTIQNTSDNGTTQMVEAAL